MTESTPSPSKSPDTSLGPRAALLGPLASCEALAAAPSTETVAIVELARSLRADVEADGRAGAPVSAYVPHNTAVLLLALWDLDPQDSRLAGLAEAAAPILLAAAESDALDLALVTALLRVAPLLPASITDRVTELGARAAESPLAGDRLLDAWSRHLASLGEGRDGSRKEQVARHAGRALALMDRILERLPYQEGVAAARLELLAQRVRTAESPARDEALGRLLTLAQDYEDRFGAAGHVEALRLFAALERVQAKGSGEGARREARTRLLALAQPGRLPDDELLRSLKAADRANLFKAEDHRQLAEALRERAASARPADQAGLQKALRRSLERAGEKEALLEELVRDVTRDPKGRDASTSLVTHLIEALRKGSDVPTVPADSLRAAAAAASRGALAKLSAEDLTRWLGHLSERLGAEGAAEHLEGQILKTRELRKLRPLYDRGVALLREAGRRDAALGLLREGFEKARHDDLRIAYARELLDLERDLPDAEDAVRPLLGAGGPLQAEAKALRDKLLAHPALEQQRRQQLLEFEDEVGIGTARAQRLRVLFTGDGFALTEVVDHPAPASYEHKHIRVMVRRSDLPGDLDIADLKKGRDVFAPVRGEDDSRKKGVLRVYWVADSALVDPGWSEDERLRRVTELEARFHIGSGASLPLRVRKVAPRRGQLWASIEAPQGAGRETFPSDVRITASDLPEGTELTDLKEGVQLYAPVDSFAPQGASPGDRRYRVRPPVEVLKEGDRA